MSSSNSRTQHSEGSTNSQENAVSAEISTPNDTKRSSLPSKPPKATLRTSSVIPSNTSPVAVAPILPPYVYGNGPLSPYHRSDCFSRFPTVRSSETSEIVPYYMELENITQTALSHDLDPSVEENNASKQDATPLPKQKKRSAGCFKRKLGTNFKQIRGTNEYPLGRIMFACFILATMVLGALVPMVISMIKGWNRNK